MALMAYAENTKVPVERSRAEVETILRRYGADQFATGWDGSSAAVQFRAHGRQVRFVLPLPSLDEMPVTDGRNARLRPEQRQAKLEQEERRRWRALVLAIKAKLEIVESGIAEFEDEFLAHILLPDNRTVGEHVRPAIDQAYELGRVPPLLQLEAGS